MFSQLVEMEANVAMSASGENTVVEAADLETLFSVMIGSSFFYGPFD